MTSLFHQDVRGMNPENPERPSHLLCVLLLFFLAALVASHVTLHVALQCTIVSTRKEVPVLQILSQNVEIVDFVPLERISARFYTQPTHVSISNTIYTLASTPFTGPVSLELCVADSVSFAPRINEDLLLTSSHLEEFVVTVDVPVPRNLEGRFDESTQEFIIEQIGDQIVDLPVPQMMPEIIDQ